MRVFFNCCSEAFGVACVPRPEQLVRSTPLLPCAMPKDGKGALACALAVWLDLSEWVELVYFFGQSFHFTLLITFC